MNAAQHRCTRSAGSAVPFASAVPMSAVGGVVVMPRLVGRRHVDLARVNSALCSHDAA